MTIVSPKYENYKFTGEYTTKYVGAVLCDNINNYLGDGDYSLSANVWDEETQSVKNIPYWSTYTGSSDPHSTVTVDATEEVKEKASKYYVARQFDTLKHKSINDSKQIMTGREVIVNRGRKVPQGTTGKVVFMQVTNYSYVKDVSVCIAIDDEMMDVKKVGQKGTEYTVQRHKNTVWTSIKNIDVVNPEQYVQTDAELFMYATQYVKNNVRM